MIGGTVNIARSIWTDAAFKEEPFTEREAFMWLVMEASFKARERRFGSTIVQLERGELASSIRFMAEAWQWSKSRVARFLDRLRDRNMIENRDSSGTASGTALTVISVCNYDEYQNDIRESGTGEKRKAGQQRDSSGTNEKKDNKDIRLDTNVSNHCVRDPEHFRRFWDEAFPHDGRKRDRKGCERLF